MTNERIETKIYEKNNSKNFKEREKFREIKITNGIFTFKIESNPKRKKKMEHKRESTTWEID